MSRPRPALQNRLLDRMPAEDFAMMQPHLEALDLPRGHEIAAPGAPVTHYYFPEAGISSIVAASPAGRRVEVGMVGRDGVVPYAAILGADTGMHEIIVQVPGHGHRIASERFADLIASRPAIRQLMQRFVLALSAQTSGTALSNAVHDVEGRLARWLLMCHDRTGSDEIPLTHDYIAVMLAVRRPSVTTALHVLEGNRLIYSTRGLVTIRDRPGLEAFAGDVYGLAEAEYERLLGPLRPG